MKNKITITLRQFPVLAHDHRTGKEEAITVPVTKEQLRAIANVARQGIKDVRRSVKALRPDALESLNLKSALIQMMEETKRSTGVEIAYQIEPALKGFNKDEEDVIYRIVQESITNAIRHGRADKVEVGIHRDFNMLKIHIEDNGVGCSKVQVGLGCITWRSGWICCWRPSG